MAQSKALSFLRENSGSWREHAKPTIRVNGNSGRVVQMFVNMLRNALNAGRAGPRTRRRALVLSRAARRAAHRRAVGAFVTTRLDARGTGLGLTVAEGIVTEPLLG